MCQCDLLGVTVPLVRGTVFLCFRCCRSGVGRGGQRCEGLGAELQLGFDFAGIGRHRNSSGQELGEEIPALGLGRELSAGTSGCRGSAGVWEV